MGSGAAPAGVLKDEDVPVGSEFLIGGVEWAGSKVALDPVGRPDRHDRDRPGRGLAGHDDGEEPDAVANRDPRLAALPVVGAIRILGHSGASVSRSAATAVNDASRPLT
jgi:hypothetical protein